MNYKRGDRNRESGELAVEAVDAAATTTATAASRTPVVAPISTTTSALRAKYRLLRGSHSRHEKGVQRIYKAGDKDRDTLVMTADEAAALGTRLEKIADMPGQYAPEVEKVEADVAETSDGDDTTDQPGQYETAEMVEEEIAELSTLHSDATGAQDWTFTQDEHWKNAVRVAESLETVADVEAMRAVESGGKNRQSVLEALDVRQAQLERSSE